MKDWLILTANIAVGALSIGLLLFGVAAFITNIYGGSP